LNGLDAIKDQTFGYDKLNRITSFDGAWGSGSFTYDVTGNRLTKMVDWVDTTYNYNSNRLTSATGNEPGSYAYNTAGHLTSGTWDGKSYALAYDGFNQVKSFTAGTALVAEAGYDGDGLRVKKTAGGCTTVYHYDPAGNVLAENHADGRPIADYVYLNGKMVAKIIPEEVPVENPEDPVENPGDPVENPEDPVENPEDPIENPGDPVENPEDPIEDPEDPIEDPGDPIDVWPPACDSGTYNPATNMCEKAVQSSYAATGTLVGGVSFNKKVDKNSFGTDKDILTSNSAITAGYIATSTFSGAKKVFKDPVGSLLNGASGSVHGYVSGSTMQGLVPVYRVTILTNRDKLAASPLSNTVLYGYMARSAGTYGGTMQHSCPSGGNLDGTTCVVDTIVQTAPDCGSGALDGENDVCH
jgi:YD repeat-containing protein